MLELGLKVVIAMVGPGIWVALASVSSIKLYRRRREPAVHFRQPYLVILVAFVISMNIGALWIATLFRSSWYDIQFPCVIFNFVVYAVDSLVYFPMVLRGAQYLANTDARYRKRLVFFRKNRNNIKATLVFAAIHSTVMMSLYLFQHRYNLKGKGECLRDMDFVYLGLIFLPLLLLTAVLAYKTRGKRDGFQIGVELRRCFALWGVLDTLALLLREIYVSKGISHVSNFTSMFMLAGTFYVIIVHPLRDFQKLSSSRTQAAKIVPVPASVHPTDGTVAKYLDTKSSTSPLYRSFVRYQHSTLAELFADKKAVKDVLEYARRHFVCEMVLFLQAVVEYRGSFLAKMERGQGTLAGRADEEDFSLYQSIMKKYVQPGSEYEINVADYQRQAMGRYYWVSGTSGKQRKGRTSVSNLEVSRAELMGIFDSASIEIKKLFWANFLGNCQYRRAL